MLKFFHLLHSWSLCVLICTAPQSFILKLKNKNLSCLFILMGFKIIKKYICFFLLCQISTFESMSFWWKGSFLWWHWCWFSLQSFMMAVQRPSHRGSGGLGLSSTFPLPCPAPKALLVCSHTPAVPCWLVQAWANFLKRLIFFTGAAIRHCDVERGWLEPDLYNCTSPPFVELNIAVRCSAVTEGLSCFFIIFCPLRLI